MLLPVAGKERYGGRYEGITSPKAETKRNAPFVQSSHKEHDRLHSGKDLSSHTASTAPQHMVDDPGGDALVGLPQVNSVILPKLLATLARGHVGHRPADALQTPCRRQGCTVTLPSESGKGEGRPPPPFPSSPLCTHRRPCWPPQTQLITPDPSDTVKLAPRGLSVTIVVRLWTTSVSHLK